MKVAIKSHIGSTYTQWHIVEDRAKALSDDDAILVDSCSDLITFLVSRGANPELVFECIERYGNHNPSVIEWHVKEAIYISTIDDIIPHVLAAKGKQVWFYLDNNRSYADRYLAQEQYNIHVGNDYSFKIKDGQTTADLEFRHIFQANCSEKDFKKALTSTQKSIKSIEKSNKRAKSSGSNMSSHIRHLAGAIRDEVGIAFRDKYGIEYVNLPSAGDSTVANAQNVISNLKIARKIGITLVQLRKDETFLQACKNMEVFIPWMRKTAKKDKEKAFYSKIASLVKGSIPAANAMNLQPPEVYSTSYYYSSSLSDLRKKEKDILHEIESAEQESVPNIGPPLQSQKHPKARKCKASV